MPARNPDRIRHAAQFHTSNIQIPLVTFDILDFHLAHSLQQNVVALLALAAADDFTDSGTSTSMARTVLPSSFIRM